MSEHDLTLLRRWRRDVARQADERERVLRALADSASRIASRDSEVARLTALGDRAGADAIRRDREALAAERERHVSALVELDNGLRTVLDRVAAMGDPGDADPAVPLALLPVRLETRFTADGRSLRVRIFPDDIHIDALDRGVSDAEREAAAAYWSMVWRASEEDAAAAWRTLVARVGVMRAAWVAQATTPTNLDKRAEDAAPLLADVSPRARRAAVARLLPDAFTAVALQGAARSTRTGRTILPEVVVGLFAGDGSPLRDVNGVKVTAGAEWMFDYAEAERIGMAVTVPLATAAKVDRLLVYGIRRSLDPEGTRTALETQLLAHRCTKGVAFVPQGTPTNNTETNRAGWQRAIEPRAPSFSPVSVDSRSNAAVVAAALGIDAQALAEVDHAAEREQFRARAMNVAMWRPSWGGFLDKINRVGANGATLSDAAKEDVRVFHRDHVRGRGPLPTVRVGDQPYGILPVSASSRWRTGRGNRFEATLREFIDKLRIRWRQCIAKVPRLGSGPIDDVLLEMLGSSAISVSLRVRPVLAEAIALLSVEASGEDGNDLDMQRILEMLLWEELHNASLVQLVGVFGESRPLALPYVHESDPAFIEALLAGGTADVKSVFQALIELAWDHAQRAVDTESASGQLAAIAVNATAMTTADRERALTLANRADVTEPHAFFAAAQSIAASLEASPPTHAEYQPVPSLSRSFGELALDTSTVAAREQLSAYAVHAWLNARGRLNELRDALIELRDTTTEERRILFAESLDLASHRLDAWVTAIVDRRLHELRASHATGLTIGAYGWVENIEPSGDRAPDGGFIHAPNIAHAATASVLRSGYLSHNADLSGDGAFAIDLTSARVRTALHLVDGIRQGQPLGALLGYRIERALHDRELDRFVLSLRAMAPLTAGQLTDRHDTVAPEALESVAAANVVDGIGLIERFQGKVPGWSADVMRTKLEAGPTDNPYITAGSWVPPSAAEWTGTTAVIEEAAAALDAVSDLLLAESVHMLVAGNPARAAAALDAASGGDTPPPEPLFVSTPSEGSLFLHRVLAVAAEDAAGWNTSRPRSAAEPRLEGWAAAHLGTPDSIAVGDNEDGDLLTLADSSLCALDVVYEATDRASFDRSLRLAMPTLRSIHDEPRPAWPTGTRAVGDVFECARALRALLVKARPATPLDLALPNAAPTRAIANGELVQAHGRAQAARDSLALACTMTEALVDDPASTDADIRSALQTFAGFGLSVPPAKDEALRPVAKLFAANARRQVENATKALSDPPSAESIAAAGQAIFGDGFWILPTIAPPATADAWTTALTSAPTGASAGAVRRFLVDVGSVRDGVRRHNEATLLAEALGAQNPPRVAQLSGAYGVQPEGWVGAGLPLDKPTPTVPVVSAILDVAGTYNGSGSTAALVLDEWIDRVPLRERRGEGAAAPIDERVTTGVSFNAMAPSARAPQAILLAVSPDGARWTGDAIVATLEETLELAKYRGVTLERTNGIARILPALFEQSWSLQGEKVLDLATFGVSELNAVAAYVKEEQP